LFALYYIYKTDDNVANNFRTAQKSSPYLKLIDTFALVEKEGWDIARLYWLRRWNILKVPGRQPTSLFGFVDEFVFNFLKIEQRYSIKITCTRYDCPRQQHNNSSTELDIL
jgi:hypothetical protein